MITRTESAAASPYTFKASPFSSHSLLLGKVPAAGAGRRLLDVGGGEGYLSRIFAQRGYRVTCLAGEGSRGEDFPARAELIESDLDFEFPRLDGPFAFIVCGDIFEHLRRPADTLRWLHRQLAPGGTLVASLPNSGHAYVRLNVLLGRFPQHDRGLFDRTHLHFYAWKQWRQLFDEAGFRIDTVEPTAVPLEVALPFLRGRLALRALERLSYALALLWKTLFAYQFVVTAHPEEE